MKRNEPLITLIAFNRHDAVSVEHLFSFQVCIYVYIIHAGVKVKIVKNNNLNSLKEPSRLEVVLMHCSGFITFVATFAV